MRGTAVATLNTLVNLLAQAFGAPLTGFLSDRYAPWAGGDALKYALFSVSWLNLAAIVLFLLIGRTLQRDLARALHEIAPRLPVLLATAPAVDISVDALAKAGISEVLRRPLSSTELAAALARRTSSAPRADTGSRPK